MTEQEKEEILKHRHTFEELLECCTINGIIDSERMDAHCVGYNGSKCDVIKGPCSCGAWH